MATDEGATVSAQSVPVRPPRSQEQAVEARRPVSSWCGTNECGECDVCALTTLLSQREEERDSARRVAVDYEAWLDEALTALQVETVFDIKERAAQLAQREEELVEAREAVAQIRPLTDDERAWQYAGDDVIHEARKLSNAPGVINTTRALDAALKKYDEARERALGSRSNEGPQDAD